jgi:septal ring factor EnvC (AmiA/AmiB activator)
VVDLTQINLATEEDIQAHRDLWASFFKATRWEELKMLAQKDTDIAKAVTMVHKLFEDKEFRQQYEAHEDRIRQQLDHDYWYDNEIKKRDAALADRDAELSDKEAAIADMDATIVDLKAEIAALKARLENI